MFACSGIRTPRDPANWSVLRRDEAYAKTCTHGEASANARYYTINPQTRNGSVRFTVTHAGAVTVRESVTKWMNNAPELSQAVRNQVYNMV